MRKRARTREREKRDTERAVGGGRQRISFTAFFGMAAPFSSGEVAQTRLGTSFVENEILRLRAPGKGFNFDFPFSKRDVRRDLRDFPVEGHGKSSTDKEVEEEGTFEDEEGDEEVREGVREDFRDVGKLKTGKVAIAKCCQNTPTVCTVKSEEREGEQERERER